ncbi:hypothetical protein U91I_02459 [alpha proteobacterium U9-1i]|nr:hypothetical protein U91I_02459 [alpha proteobacterium U9-1i]
MPPVAMHEACAPLRALTNHTEESRITLACGNEKGPRAFARGPIFTP